MDTWKRERKRNLLAMKNIQLKTFETRNFLKFSNWMLYMLTINKIKLDLPVKKSALSRATLEFLFLYLILEDRSFFLLLIIILCRLLASNEMSTCQPASQPQMVYIQSTISIQMDGYNQIVQSEDNQMLEDRTLQVHTKFSLSHTHSWQFIIIIIIIIMKRTLKWEGEREINLLNGFGR